MRETHGVTTCHCDDAAQRSDCVLYALLAHAPVGEKPRGPRAVSREQCAALRTKACVRIEGDLSDGEVDAVLS